MVEATGRRTLSVSGESWRPSPIDHRVVGCDAWQALTLAIRLAEQMLTYFVEDGGCLYWGETGGPMAISDVFPRASKAK